MRRVDLGIIRKDWPEAFLASRRRFARPMRGITLELDSSV